MNTISIVSSLILIVGCFMPWLQLGSLIANRGIDNPDGAIVLVAGIISGAVAINNLTKNEEKNSWVFTVVGILGLLIVFYDLNEVHDRAKKLAKGVTELGSLIGENKKVSISNFVGSGLYIVCAGSAGLLLSGLGIFNTKRNQVELNSEPQIQEPATEIVAPKFAKIEEAEEVKTINEIAVKIKTPEKIENEAYKENLIKLNQVIESQRKKLIGGGMNNEIKELLSELVRTKQEGVHLLNSYKFLFKKELIDDLAKLNNSYIAIRENISLFVDLNIVSDTFPHKRI